MAGPLGKEPLAEEVFARQAQRIAPLLEQPSTGKRCAFFSITSSGLATVRKSGDYVAQMIGMAGVRCISVVLNHRLLLQGVESAFRYSIFE